MNKYVERIYNGVHKENPTLVLMLGMCPTLAVSTSASNGIGMGLSTMVVLVASNFLISLLRKVIPDEVRLPSYIVIVATLVTAVELLIEGFLPSLYDALGIYIPLIVVNCIILGRAEAYANKHEPLLAIMDGLGMGLGFTISLTILGFFRELIGAGTVFGHQVLPDSVEPIGIFVKSPGAFLVIAFIIMFMNKMGKKTRANALVNGMCFGCSVCLVYDHAAAESADEKTKQAQAIIHQAAAKSAGGNAAAKAAAKPASAGSSAAKPAAGNAASKSTSGSASAKPAAANASTASKTTAAASVKAADATVKSGTNTTANTTAKPAAKAEPSKTGTAAGGKEVQK